MVAEDNGGGYAQIGFTLKNAGTYLRYFWEWTKTGNPFYQSYFGIPSVGLSNNFKVSRYPSDGHFHLLLDNDAPPCNTDGVCPQTNFDPLVQWSGRNNQWYGETFHPGDDVAGLVDSKNDFSSVQTLGSDDNWHTYGFTSFASDECYYKQGTVDDGHF